MAVPLFTHIDGAHPFAGEIRRLRDTINAEKHAAALYQATGSAAPLIHSEIKALPAEDGGFVFDRFYWSLQIKTPNTPAGLTALTLTSAPAKGTEPAWLSFPDDPYLTRASAYFAANDDARRDMHRDVLRYVPLRRLTFLERDAGGSQRIGKFKRRSRFREAYALLGCVSDAVAGADVSFSVSRPLAIDEEQALYFQSCLAGDPAPDLIGGETAASIMEHMGRIHAELHTLPAWAPPTSTAMARLTNAALLARAERDVALIGFYVEDLAAALMPLLERLRTRVPDEELTAVCHGDFVPSQMLRDGDTWSIIDFDLVTVADPYHDLSIFIAALDFDVPWIEAHGSATTKERCANHYLEGYAERRGKPVDRRRLAWHRTAAEIYYLALMLKKDRFDRARAMARIASLRAVAEDLS